MSPGKLAERLALTRGGAVTQMIDRLERAGLARRRRDTDDRRRVMVEITGLAGRLIGPLFTDFSAAWAAHLDRYDDDQLALVLDFIQRGNEIVHQMTR